MRDADARRRRPLPRSASGRLHAARVLASAAVTSLCAALWAPFPAEAQSRLERTSVLDGGWIGEPWAFHLDFGAHVPVDGPGYEASVLPTFHATFSAPVPLLFGARYAANVRTEGFERIWELYARYVDRPFETLPGLDVAVTGWYSAGSESLDAEALVAHWFGPARLVGVFRTQTSLLPEERVPVVAGGALVHVVPGRLPLAAAFDFAQALDAGVDFPFVWSTGVHAGIPRTGVTASLLVTNALAPTLQAGALAAEDGVRLGLAVSAPVPLGRILGARPHRWVGRDAVIEGALPSPGAARAPIRNYAFTRGRIHVPAGAVVEWENEDATAHTVTADDGSFDSGPLREGEAWRAQFLEPGVYIVRCRLHPYMRSVVVVEDR
jgi:hypothetical protein